MDVTNSSRIQRGAIPDQYQIANLEARRKQAGGSQAPREGDRVVLSDHARLLKELSESVDNAPDLREDKVAELRAAIESGKYQISYEEIARAIIASRDK